MGTSYEGGGGNCSCVIYLRTFHSWAYAKRERETDWARSIFMSKASTTNLDFRLLMNEKDRQTAIWTKAKYIGVVLGSVNHNITTLGLVWLSNRNMQLKYAWQVILSPFSFFLCLFTQVSLSTYAMDINTARKQVNQKRKESKRKQCCKRLQKLNIKSFILSLS